MSPHRPFRQILGFVAAFFFFHIFIVVDSNAQITLDGTLGPGGALTGPDYVITEKMGRQHGTNLFHSFGDFNIRTQESATFTGPNTVENIVGRVTGGSLSNIDGRLSSSIDGANLYLINPSGMMFGPNATLDVSGSFHASTADSVQLKDGGRFDAAQPSNSLLTSAPPSAFGFLDDDPAPISVRGGFLKVPEGKTLSVVGGDVSLEDSTLYAPGGRINVVSAGSAGEAFLDDWGMKVNSFERMGAITISHSSSERPEENGITLGNIDVSSDGGGSVFIRGGRFTIDGAYIYANSRGSGNAQGVDIQVSGETTFSDTKGLSPQSGIHTLALGTGNAGDISLKMGSLTLRDGSAITSSSFGQGHGGHLAVTAEDFVYASGQSTNDTPSGLGSNAFNTGDGGSVFLSAPFLHLDNEGAIQAFTNNEGNAGSIFLEVGRLALTGGGYIDTSTTGAGDGGMLSVKAREFISVSGRHPIDSFSSTLLSAALGTGKGGTIFLSSPSLTLGDQAQITASTLGEGDAGDIMLDVGALSLTGGAKMSTNTYSKGRGGNITVSATESIFISDYSSSIESETAENSSGDAGHIHIKTPDLTMTHDGRVGGVTYGQGRGADVLLEVAKTTLVHGGKVDISNAGTGPGGSVTLNATDSISISGTSDTFEVSSGIFSLANGSGDAGNVDVETSSLEITDGGTISGMNSGQGYGGETTIRAADWIRISGQNPIYNSSIVRTAFKSGDAGRISIETPYLLVADGAGISGGSIGKGKGAEIDVKTQRLEVNNKAFIESTAMGIGHGGRITVSATDFALIADGALMVDAIAAGNAGSIYVDAETLSLTGDARITSSSSRSGNAGDISLNAGTLNLSGGSQIATGTYGSGQGGVLRASARESISILTGPSPLGGHSGLFSNAFATGNGGTIHIETPSLTMDNGLIQAGTEGAGKAGSIFLDIGRLVLMEGSQVSTASRGPGEGGQLDIVAGESVLISGLDKTGVFASGLFSSANGTGIGGSIRLKAKQIYLEDGGGIAAESTETGNAGNITIHAAEKFRSRNSSFVTTAATRAGGGNILITGRDIRLINRSDVTASVTQGESSGGNVSFDAKTLVALDDSDITARADQGFGGNILINAQVVLFSEDIDLDASSNVIGKEGTVTINSPDTDISGYLVELAASFLRAEALLPRHCAARDEEEDSTFLILGTGGVPPKPDAL